MHLPTSPTYAHLAVPPSANRSKSVRKNDQRTSPLRSVNAQYSWEWDLRTGQFSLPKELCQHLGYRPSEVDDLVDAWFALIHPGDTERVATAVDDVLSDATGNIEFRHRMLQKNGDVQWVDTAAAIVRDDDGEPIRLSGTKTMLLSEVSSNRDASDQHGILNRQNFLHRLSDALKSASDNNANPLSSPKVLVVELTRYAQVKAALGAQAAELLVVEFSRRLKARLPADQRSTMARLDESHLSLIATQATIDECVRTVSQLIKKPLQLLGRDVFVTVNMGINACRTRDQKPDEVVRDALVAASQQKLSNHEQPTTFENEMHRESLERLTLETELRFAIQNREFELHYQPIISLNSGAIIGFEALLRWKSPSRGFVSPECFIPLAEETGLINPIGEWVLCEAVNELERLHDSGLHSPHLSISVNLSPCQFFEPSLLRTLRRCLSKARFQPSQLILEITESVLLDNNEEATRIFEELRAMGVRLHMDDFGTGYSSFSLLRRCPVDKLKIDRSFVRSLTHNEADQAIVRAIMTLTQSLGKNVIAEGIETPEQLQYLRSLGCTYGQGHYFAKPIPAPSSWVKQAANTPQIGVSAG